MVMHRPVFTLASLLVVVVATLLPSTSTAVAAAADIHKQENVTQQQQPQNMTTTPPQQPQQYMPSSGSTANNPPPPPQQQQPQQQNMTSGGGVNSNRPSAVSQLEVRTLGNHTWMEPNGTRYEQNDYSIVNHSPSEICNVTLRAPIVNPEQTRLSSSYNLDAKNSTQSRGWDVMVPKGDAPKSIPPNGGSLNVGYILASEAQGNNTATGAPAYVTDARYCDEAESSQGQQGKGMTSGTNNYQQRNHKLYVRRA